MDTRLRLDFKDVPPYKEVAYDTDQLRSRKAFGEKLTSIVERLSNGGVLCVDAGWGEGKTWFAQNWKHDLLSKSYSVGYLDAFRHDHVEDPFLVIVSALREAMRETGELQQLKGNFIESAKRIGVQFVPAAVKAGLGALIAATAGPLAAVGAQAAAEIVIESTTDLAKKTSEDVLENLKEEKNNEEEFRNSIRAYVSKLEHPLILIIDELDRCAPTFAIRLLERLKHYFDEPNLAFVLMCHRSQLEHSIKALYGDIDANLYLSKFIHLTFELPKVTKGHSSLLDATKIVADKCKRVFGQINDDLVINCGTAATLLGLSLRDTARVFDQVLLMNFDAETFPDYFYGLALRRTDPNTFHNLLKKNKETISALLIKIDGTENDKRGYLTWLASQYLLLLGGANYRDFEKFSPEFQEHFIRAYVNGPHRHESGEKLIQILREISRGLSPG